MTEFEAQAIINGGSIFLICGKIAADIEEGFSGAREFEATGAICMYAALVGMAWSGAGLVSLAYHAIS